MLAMLVSDIDFWIQIERNLGDNIILYVEFAGEIKGIRALPSLVKIS